jgi:two-component system, OmpR family, response regulator
MTVLLVEDNASLARNMARYLEAEDYDVLVAADGQEALDLAESITLSIVILDLNLPKIDGIDVCRCLREQWQDLPIIMVTARSAKAEIIQGLEAGGDDYLVKPFEMEELVARMRALERRSGMHPRRVIEFADCRLDTTARTVARAGELVRLAPREYQLVEFLATHRGEPQTREAIVSAVWGGSIDIAQSKTLDVHISYVRRKLGRGAIVTTPEGYMIAGETADAG